MEKTELRATMRRTLKELSFEQVRLYSGAACARVIQHPAFLRAETVFLYAAMPQEADPSAIAAYALQTGKRVAYPYCVDATQIVAMQPNTPYDLERGAYGIFAPVPERSGIIPPQEVDFVLISGLAFDSHGGRLGRGAGFYDRYLSSTPAFRAGFCFSMQLVSDVPMQPHDLFMDAVFTNDTVYTVSSK